MKISSGIIIFTISIVAIAVLSNAGESYKEYSSRAAAPKEPVATNVSVHRIYIKELTTGDDIGSKKYPKLKTRTGSLASFDYQFFDKVRLFTAETNQDNVVVKLKFLDDAEFDDLRSAVESKLSELNGRNIKFDCISSKEKVPPLEWGLKTCKIISGKQVLEKKEYKLLTKKPDHIGLGDWMNIGIPNSFVLTELIELSEKTKNRIKAEEEKREKEIKEQKSRASKDV